MERPHVGSEQGQTMAEYGVVLAVITVSIVMSFAVLASAVEGAIQAVLDLVGGVV